MITRASDVLDKVAVPTRIVVLPPSAWSAAYKDAPRVEVAIGLRFLSHEESELATTAAEARADASRLTGDAHATVYNDELMVQAVGFAACDPNKATEGYFKLTAEDARKQLTPHGVRRLWDELELAHAADDPLIKPADDTDLADLGECLLDPDGLTHLSPADDLMVRRWARELLTLLRPAR